MFKRVDGLLGTLAPGKGREEMTRVIQFLSDYVVFHFGIEENYMTKFAYQNSVQHKAQHDQFVRTFGRLKDRLLMEGISPELTQDAKQLVVDWLINHIKYSDKALGLFLKRKL